MPRPIPEAVRFTADDPRIEVATESGCWVWARIPHPNGYARTSVRGPAGLRTVFCHRLVWEKLRGPIPDGMVLDHICRVRRCVNPDHLRVVTPRQNVLENSMGHTAINAAKTCCPKCGGPYTTERNGRRRCNPCMRIVWRRKHQKRRDVLAAQRATLASRSANG